MNSLMRRTWYLSAAALLLFAATGFGFTVGSQVTVQFGTASVYPGWGGVYVDPYGAVVGPVGSAGVSTVVQCDDWADHITIPETWTATVVSAAGLVGGTPLFSAQPGSGITTQQLYDAVALLATEILQTNNATTQGELSYAMWYLTCEYGTPGSACASQVTSNYGGPGGSSYIETLASNALTNATSSSAAGWQILVPDMPTGGWGSEGQPQEFMVYVPEPSTSVLLGVALFGMLAAAFVYRRSLRPTN